MEQHAPAAAESAPLNMPGYQKFTAFPGIDLFTLTLPAGSSFSIDFAKREKTFEFGYILKGTARTFLHESPSSIIELSPKSAVIHYLPGILATFEVAPKPDIRMLGIDVHLRDSSWFSVKPLMPACLRPVWKRHMPFCPRAG